MRQIIRESGSRVRLLAVGIACLALLTACAAAAIRQTAADTAHAAAGSAITVASLPAQEMLTVPVDLTVDEKQLTWPPDDTAADVMVVYTIENQSGQGQSYVNAPELERWLPDGSWDKVPYAESALFCGTPDPLQADQVVGQAPLSWWQLGPDSAGVYRLSLTVQLEDGGTVSVSDTFELRPPAPST